MGEEAIDVGVGMAIPEQDQIRRHLKHVSHHLIGDSSHGDGRHNRNFRTLPEVS